MTELSAKMFGQRLRVAMAIKDWSGADLGRALDMTRAACCPWMRGDSIPPASRITEIARAVDVDVSWLVAPYPVDLHGPSTDELRATLIGLHVAGILSEGQTAKSTGLDRVEVRKRADQHLADWYGNPTPEQPQ